MSPRKLAAALALALAAVPAHAELLKLSLLQKPAPRFTLRQDLFGGGEPPAPRPAQAAAVQAEGTNPKGESMASLPTLARRLAPVVALILAYIAYGAEMSRERYVDLPCNKSA